MTDLHDLLDQRARQGSVHPSMQGVQDAVGRRRARRRRTRALGGGVAAVCLLAGVLGGIALSSGDDADETPVSTVDLPEVQLVGVDLDGFVLTDGTVGPLDDENVGDAEPVTYVTFRGDESLASPFVNVTIQAGFDAGTPMRQGRPVDLDHDGSNDAEQISTPSGDVAVVWTLDDGRIVGVNGYALPEADVLDYAADLRSDEELDARTLATPDLLPERTVATVPSGVSEQAVATYRNGAREVRVSATNEPGWFDILQSFVVSAYGPLEEAELGDTFLGPAEAVIAEPASGHAYALIRTESGLTVELSSDNGVHADELRDVLAAGRLVELDADNLLAAETTPSTVVEAATTTVVTTTMTVEDGHHGTQVIDVRHDDLPDGDRLVVKFADEVPEHVLEPTDEPFGGDCGPAPIAGESYFRLRLADASPSGLGLDGERFLLADSPVQVWTCGSFEGYAYLAISINRQADAQLVDVPEDEPLVVIDFPG